MQIQSGEHSPAEDAIGALELYKKYRKPWERWLRTGQRPEGQPQGARKRFRRWRKGPKAKSDEGACHAAPAHRALCAGADAPYMRAVRPCDSRGAGGRRVLRARGVGPRVGPMTLRARTRSPAHPRAPGQEQPSTMAAMSYSVSTEDMKSFTPQELEELKRNFRGFDEDNNGSIDKNELVKARLLPSSL